MSEKIMNCPHCGKIFIVSGTRIHSGVRKCPDCGGSTRSATLRAQNQEQKQASNGESSGVIFFVILAFNS